MSVPHGPSIGRADLAEAHIDFLREATLTLEGADAPARIFLADGERLELDESDFSNLLPAPEIEAAGRFVTAELRRRSLVARAVLRTILGRYMDRPPRAVPLTRTDLGKPYTPGGPSFNLSHSGSLVLVAVRPTGRLGVDIEVHRPSTDLEAVARRFFTRVEWEEVARDPSGVSLAFHRTWVRKEALLKGLGTGLYTPLDRFSVETRVLAEGRNALRWMDIEGETAEGWGVTPLRVAPGAEAALAWEKRSKALNE